MTGRGKTGEPELTALLIAADRQLAQQLNDTLRESRTFQVISELKAYPSRQTLEIRLRQVRPEVILLDLSSDLEAAAEVIRCVASFEPATQVVGLQARNAPEVLLNCLRLGASEFLCAPFSIEEQRVAVTRLRRLRGPDEGSNAQPGSVAVFSSAKPGSGASTLALQTAFTLRRHTGGRVLLADLDLTGGTIGVYAKPAPDRSILDALQQGARLNRALWSSLVTNCEGVDIVSAPDTPYIGAIDPAALSAVVEHVRMNYDWVLIDLPVIFERISLIAVSNADNAFLVSTAELPSLHLARKAAQLLDRLGIPKERFSVVLNRVTRHDEIAHTNMEQLFNCPVFSMFPEDAFSLHRFVTLGQALDGKSVLGQAIEQFSNRLSRTADRRFSTAETAPTLAGVH
jgi:pilus assembly protein CpaE